MIKKYTTYFVLSFVLEALLGVVALWLSSHLGALLSGRLPASAFLSAHLLPPWAFLLVAAGGPLLLYLNRAHSFPTWMPVRELAWPTVKAMAQVALGIIAVSFILKGPGLSRAALVIFVLLGTALILLKRLGLKIILARSAPARQILLIGNASAAKLFIAALREKWPCGVSVFGLLTDDPALEAGDEVAGVAVIGRVGGWENVLRHNQMIDEVMIFPNGKMGVNLNQILRLGRELEVKVRVAVGEPEAQFNPTLQRFGWANLISFQPDPENFVSQLCKRAIDRAGSLLLIALLSPVLILIALLIKIGSPGPVIFTQLRMGFRGRPFRMFKFRTMYADAEKQRENLLAENEMSGPVFKIRDDPRTTRVGKLLRLTSLDELPQLFNVLAGEMSLVGPRPLPLYEADKCDRWEKRRFSIRPGITCLWQINGRNLLDYAEWMRLDLQYVNNWSLLLDFKILLKTVGVVLSGKGAC